MPINPNKVKYNLLNVHYALMNVSESGIVTFGTPKPLPGAVNLTLTPQGDSSTFYADGIAYYVSVANGGYQGDLELALIPDYFSQDALGETLDETDKVMVEHAYAEPSLFALLFQIMGNVHGVRNVLYGCTASRPNIAAATTTNTKEPQTATLPITAAPMADGIVKAYTTKDTPETVYNNWYKNVWMPALPEAV